MELLTTKHTKHTNTIGNTLGLPRKMRGVSFPFCVFGVFRGLHLHAFRQAENLRPARLTQHHAGDNQNHRHPECVRQRLVEKMMRPKAGAQRNQVAEQQNPAGAPVAQRAVPKRIRHHAAEDDAERQHAGLRAVHCKTAQRHFNQSHRQQPDAGHPHRVRGDFGFGEFCAQGAHLLAERRPQYARRQTETFAEQAQLHRPQRRPEQNGDAGQRQQSRAITPRARPSAARFLLPQQRPDRRGPKIKRHVRRRREPQRPVENDNINRQRQAAAQPKLPAQFRRQRLERAEELREAQRGQQQDSGARESGCCR